MSLKEYASRKIRRDTAGNWSSNNPTPLQGEWCLEIDTGNVKIGDGSTAWNSLGYYIPAKLAIPYNLTSANETHTLPPITGAPQTESVYWTGGGTYKLTLAVTDGATVGGETAGTWKGEGNGHIELESDGSNWQVRAYEDSGSNGNGSWKKEKDGSLYQYNKYSYNVPSDRATFSSNFALPLVAHSIKGLTFSTYCAYHGTGSNGTTRQSQDSNINSGYINFTYPVNVPSGSAIVISWQFAGSWK